MQDRIVASRTQAAARASENLIPIAENTENSTNIFPNLSISSPLFSLQNFTMPTGSGPSNSEGNPTQAQNTQVAHVSTGRKMPRPGEKNAPTFDTSKPEELGRFFERMEDWFDEEGIDQDAEKKIRIVKYLEPEPEQQWKALSKFKNGTFAEFKAQVMASYPKAEEVMKGSVTALTRKINRLGPVPADDRNELLDLIRTMTAEVQKLKKITPPIHTNRELVELFLKRLTPEFANRVAAKLSFHRVMNVAEALDAQGQVRNPEDMFDIEEVMDMAKLTSMEQANPFGKFITSGVGPSTESHVRLEEAIVRLSDTLDIQAQSNKRIEQRLSNLQSFVNQPRPAQNGYGLPAAQTGFGRALLPPSNSVSREGTGNCFYCGLPGHRIPDCEEALKHLDLGWVKKIDNQLRLPDGSRVPFEKGKTMKEIIEALNKPKPGLIQMSRIADKSSLYRDQNNASSFVQSGQEGDEDSIRVLLDLVQKIGTDKLQKMLTQQLDEEDPWNQNFDLVQ